MCPFQQSWVPGQAGNWNAPGILVVLLGDLSAFQAELMEHLTLQRETLADRKL